MRGTDLAAGAGIGFAIGPDFVDMEEAGLIDAVGTGLDAGGAAFGAAKDGFCTAGATAMGAAGAGLEAAGGACPYRLLLSLTIMC